MKIVAFLLLAFLLPIFRVNCGEKSQALDSLKPAPAITTTRQKISEKAIESKLSASSISKAAESILNSTNKYYFPRPDELEHLTESDRPFLIKEFRDQSVTNKIYSFWALMYLGGGNVRDEIIQFLEADHLSESLNTSDMRAIESIALGLGNLAKEDSLAYDYLLSHIKPDDWIGVRKWEIIGPHRDLNAFIASTMIVGVGISGRQNALDKLNTILEWDNSSLNLVGSSVVEAFAYLHQEKSKTTKESVISRLNTDRIDNYLNWYQTEEGRKWHNWWRSRQNLK